MRCHFNKSGVIIPGDILQCPACRWKFVLLPDMIHYGDYWDAQTQGAPPPGWKDEPSYVICPKCSKSTHLPYYEELSLTGGIELTNRGKNDDTKEVKPDGQPGPRKGVSKQRTRVKDGDQAHPKKTRSPRSKGA
jgi:hypothetical protein